MDPLLKKLNYKDGSDILVINIPIDCDQIIENFSRDGKVLRDVKDIGDQGIEFALVFLFNSDDINTLLPSVLDRVVGDAIIWLAYPKKSSKKYSSDIDRDHGWSLLGEYGYEPVRQVAINEDLSALRFRKVDFIKKFVRDKEMILSIEGMARRGKEAEKEEEGSN